MFRLIGIDRVGCNATTTPTLLQTFRWLPPNRRNQRSWNVNGFHVSSSLTTGDNYYCCGTYVNASKRKRIEKNEKKLTKNIQKYKITQRFGNENF